MNKILLIKTILTFFLGASIVLILAYTGNLIVAFILFIGVLLIEPIFKKLYTARNRRLIEIMQKARVEAELGNQQAMSSLFQKAIDLAPNNYLVYYEYGKRNLEIKNHNKALDCFNQSLKINSKFIPAYLSRAYVYYSLKDYKKSLHDCNIVIDSGTNDPDCQFFPHIVKGGIYIYLEKFDKALNEFNYSLKINPKSAWSYVCKSELHCYWGKYEQSLKNAEIALSMDSNDSNIEIIYVWRAWAYYGLGKIEEAIKDCEFCIQNEVDNPKPFEILGQINESNNNLRSALEYFKKAKEVYDKDQYGKNRQKKQYDEIIQAINNIQANLNKGN